jgi:hypothetical protein
MAAVSVIFLSDIRVPPLIGERLYRRLLCRYQDAIMRMVAPRVFLKRRGAHVQQFLL